MIHGMDTGFLAAAEVLEHADHAAARGTLQQLVGAGDRIAIAPQLLAEFVHVVTDPQRFTLPLDIDAARRIAEQWWTARDVQPVYPNAAAAKRFLAWHRQFLLGRKRLLDTLLAATFWDSGIGSVLTTNAKDFAVFGIFTLVLPGAPSTTP